MRRIVSLLMGLVLVASVPLFQLGQARDAMAAAAKPAGVAADTFTPGPAKQGGRSTAPGNNVRAAGTKSEVASRRGQNSKTFATNRGYETDIYSSSVNFKDAAGNWQAIDDTLVPANVPGFALRNKSNAYTAYLPSTLASPIHFTIPNASVDFGLITAAATKPASDATTNASPSGSLKNSGATATYSNVVTGADVAFAAQPDSLKESITLLNAQAPDKFTSSLTLSPGLSVKQNTAGGIDILDAAGKPVAQFRAPYMYDASHKATGVSHSVTMTLGAGNQTITVAADSAWLSAKERQYPVVIDPTIDTNINYYDPHDCFIQNTSPNGSFCSSQGTTTATTNPLGFDGTTVNRNLYWFGSGTSRYTVPVPNANILDAELDFTLASSTSGTAVPVTVYPITQAWDDAGASWNNANTGVPWTTAGGTVGPPITTVNVGPTAGAVAIYNLTSTVQNWVNGSGTDNGLLLRAANEGTTGLLQLDNDNFGTSSTDPSRPHLRIQWNAWGGLQSWYHFEGKQLTDRMSIAVNVANGQLVVRNQDLAMRGTGQNLTVDRYYNSLSDINWHLGNGWNLNAGCDIKIDIDDHDGVAYWGPDGYQVLFRNNGSGGYVTPPGLNADLVKNGDGTFTLTYHGSNQKLNFQTGGCLQNMIDRNGNTISMSYNGSLASITDTQNRATTFTYASPIDTDFISQMTDPANRTYKYSYDTNRNLLSYTDANNNVTNYAYNANDQLSQIKDPNSNIVNFTYSTTYPQPLTQISYVNTGCSGGACNTNFAYGAGAGPCTSSGTWQNTVVTDANNHATTYCYDNAGRVAEVRDANNNKRNTSYSTNNNVASLTNSISAITSLTYDTSSNLTQIQAPPSGSGQTAAATNFGYQAPGQPFQPSSRTNPLGNCRAFTYDASGNVANVYDGQPSPCDGSTGGSHLSNAYQGDPGVSCPPAKNGELCSTTDAKGNKTSYGYDSNGNVASVTPPAPLGATTVTVDSLSRVTSVTDGKGQKTSYSYDALDRVTQIIYGGATTCTSSSTCTSVVFDPDGNVTSRVDNTGTTSFTYDTMNRLTKKILPDVATACAAQGGLTFAYDAVGNITQYCDSGGSVSYAYDNVNRTATMAEPGGSCAGTPILCTSYVYDNADRLTKLTFPGGATQNLTYDTAGNELSAIGKDSTGAVLTSFTYTYNQAIQDRGQRLTMAEADAVANLTTSYTYDAFGRLTDAANAQGSLHYRYDANGNRCRTDTSACLGGSQDPYQYNSANELTSSPGIASYSYDADGNLSSSSSGGSFSYNLKNQTATTTWGGQTLSGLTYAGAGQAERTTVGSASLASSPLGLQVSTSSSQKTYFLRDGKANLLGERLPEGSHWYFLKDGLGSIVALINGAGSVIGDRYGYDPFGKTSFSSGTVANPFGFVGGYEDVTGLVKFGARYYDPNLGRWTQPDPAGGSNLYVYSACNPVNSIDPTGLFCWSDALLAEADAVEAVLSQWGSWISEQIPDMVFDWLKVPTDPTMPPGIASAPNPLADYYHWRAGFYKAKAQSDWSRALSFDC